MLANPFIVYVASFAGVIAAYQLGWSEACRQRCSRSLPRLLPPLRCWRG
jgi:hypothetical protein